MHSWSMRINWIAIIRTAKLDCPVSVLLPFPARTGEGVPDGVMAAAKKERGSTDFLESLIFNSFVLLYCVHLVLVIRLDSLITFFLSG